MCIRDSVNLMLKPAACSAYLHLPREVTLSDTAVDLSLIHI
nr:hypothetical protein [Pseudomonas sp. HS-2]